MAIWKSRLGGYHSGNKESDTDIELVRAFKFLDLMDESNVWERDDFRQNEETVRRVLSAMRRLTPDGKDRKAWKEIHVRN